jgi:hypothetical protein
MLLTAAKNPRVLTEVAEHCAFAVSVVDRMEEEVVGIWITRGHLRINEIPEAGRWNQP